MLQLAENVAHTHGDVANPLLLSKVSAIWSTNLIKIISIKLLQNGDALSAHPPYPIAIIVDNPTELLRK